MVPIEDHIACFLTLRMHLTSKSKEVGSNDLASYMLGTLLPSLPKCIRSRLLTSLPRILS
ncbi:unnamed protein product [Prunus brigantina]